MGYYIQVPGNKNKALQLAGLYDGEILPTIPAWKEIPNGKVLVVVIDNGPFEAAAIVYSSKELIECTRLEDRRPKQAVLLDRGMVLKLCPGVASKL